MAYQNIPKEAAALGRSPQALGSDVVVMVSPQRVYDWCGAVDGATKPGGGERCSGDAVSRLETRVRP
jgi:hypothetical protein